MGHFIARFDMKWFMALALVAVLSEATTVSATTKTWGDGSNNWSNASLWLPVGVPAANDIVNININSGAGNVVNYDYAGPAVTLSQLTIDRTDAGTATNSLSMAANSLTSAFEYVGYNGRGVVNHSGGLNTIAAGAGYLDVGVFAGATGTYNLSNLGALLANANEYIGDIGTGVFNQTDGSNTIAAGSNLYLGYNAAGTGGAYSLSGGFLTANGDEYVGYGSTGTFTQNGGTNTIAAGTLSIGVSTGAASGMYTLNAGNLQVTTGDESVGFNGAGVFVQNGGVNSIGGELHLATGGSSTGTYTLTAGALSANLERLGTFGAATFNQPGGTNTTVSLLVGFATGPMNTYNLSGSGALVAAGETVGFHGNGTMNQTGGTNTVSGKLEIGADLSPSRVGIYNLSGGQASIGTNAFVGGIESGPVGKGSMTVSGTGMLTVAGSLTVYATTGTSLNLSGGTINAAAINLNGVPSLLNWTSGKLNITTTVTWDSSAAPTSTSAIFGSSRTLDSTQELDVTGNESLGGAAPFALTLNSGSSHVVGGTLTVPPSGTLTQNAGSALSYASLIQTGGAINGTLVNATSLVYHSGLFSARLINQGAVAFDSSFTAANGVDNQTTMALAPGQTLTANGAGFDNHGDLIVNGLVVAPTLTNSGLLRGAGQVTAATTNAASGDIRVEAGEHLRFAGASFANQGLVEAIGSIAAPAEVRFSSPVINLTTDGLIAGSNCLLRFDGGLANEASFVVSTGSNNVFGDVTNAAAGKIIITGGASATFYDDVVQNGVFRVSKVGSTTSVAVILGSFSGSGGSTGGGDIFFEGDLRPGNSPATVNFDNNIGFGSDAGLDIELGGTVPGSKYDQVHVTGALAIGGKLKIDLIDLGAGIFAPSLGDSFDILDWGTLSGTFDAIQLPALPGTLAWDTSQLYTVGILSVVSGIPGDYNNNGVVDAADYVVWRDGLGTAYTQSDYNVWRAHFGQTAGSGLGVGMSAAVPEPATLVLLLLVVTGECLRRSRSTDKVPESHHCVTVPFIDPFFGTVVSEKIVRLAWKSGTPNRRA